MNMPLPPRGTKNKHPSLRQRNIDQGTFLHFQLSFSNIDKIAFFHKRLRKSDNNINLES